VKDVKDLALSSVSRARANMRARQRPIMGNPSHPSHPDARINKINVVTVVTAVTGTPSQRQEQQQERAAIVEFDARIPRAWAEGFAQLHPDRPPAGVPLMRRQQFVDDVGRFLDDGFAKKAAVLGLGPFDLFECDADRPFARIDQQGLCWLIAGNRLVDLSKNAAIIETWTGARQTWRRKQSNIGRVLAWELVS